MAIDFVGEIQAQDTAIKEQKRRDRAELYARQDTAFQKNLSMDKMKLEATKLNADAQYKNAVLGQNQIKLMNDQANAQAMINLRQQTIQNQADQFNQTLGQRQSEFAVTSGQTDRRLGIAEGQLGVAQGQLDLQKQKTADDLLTSALGRKATEAELSQFTALSPFVIKAAQGEAKAIDLGNEISQFTLDSQKTMQPILQERAELENLYKSGQIQQQEYENRLLGVSTKYADQLAQLGIQQQELALKETPTLTGGATETAKVMGPIDYMNISAKKSKGAFGSTILGILGGSKFGSKAWENSKVKRQLKQDVKDQGYTDIVSGLNESINQLKSGNITADQITAFNNQATNILNSVDIWPLNKGQRNIIKNRAQSMSNVINTAYKNQAMMKK